MITDQERITITTLASGEKGACTATAEAVKKALDGFGFGYGTVIFNVSVIATDGQAWGHTAVRVTEDGEVYVIDAAIGQFHDGNPEVFIGQESKWRDSLVSSPEFDRVRNVRTADSDMASFMAMLDMPPPPNNRTQNINRNVRNRQRNAPTNPSTGGKCCSGSCVIL